MARKQNRYTKLQALTRWYKVKDVNNMLMAGESPRKVAIYCCQHGFEISEAKMYEYRKTLQQAIGKQVSVERLLGVNAPKENPYMMQVMMESNVKNLVKSEMEVLDAIIQKGYTLMNLPNAEVEIKDVIKAIETKNKITGGTHGGLTGYGLSQLRELENTKMEVMMDIIGKYLSAEQMEEMYEEVSKAEREFYKLHAPEMLEEYDDMIQEEMDNMEVGELLEGDDVIPLTELEDRDSPIVEIEEDKLVHKELALYCVKCKEYTEPSKGSNRDWEVFDTRCNKCGTLLSFKER